MKTDPNLTIWNVHGHLTAAALVVLLDEQTRLPEEELLNMMEHIGCCEQCATAFAEAAVAAPLPPPPAGFAESVLVRKRLEDAPPADTTPKASKHRRTLLLYSYRAAVAACVVLAVALSGVFQNNEAWQNHFFFPKDLSPPAISWMQTLSQNFTDLSRRFFVGGYSQ